MGQPVCADQAQALPNHQKDSSDMLYFSYVAHVIGVSYRMILLKYRLETQKVFIDDIPRLQLRLRRGGPWDKDLNTIVLDVR